ncbi:M20 metallopeptidase family protein [Paenibacillus eucommiae]|uniref:Amidohydrolase n=1 Tax=Paenibacillus eucommiae TaxID=1355755 RepID=A0ABS4IXD2_9BACL|nr:amidohydrolase [Paenibacillus eucommiae]MBP1992207.1 amidohydrolase [Paenibacillus eucommiae]
MNTGPILSYIESLEQELVELRRDFHKYPEVLYDVGRTAAKVAELLDSWGLEVERHVGKHFGMGVTATLRGGRPGRTVLLRADMDALPIFELNEVDYRSEYPGKMHACGHDVHTAMLLGAAKALSTFRDELTGIVKFVFQPAEEGALPSPIDGRLLSGGRDMIEAGILEGVDICFAQHVKPELPVGTLGVHPKYAMAASSHFKVEFQGKAGHHSTPHQAVDAILMAAQFITEAKVMMASEVNPVEPAVLAFGTVHAGSAVNVIADRSELAGTYRAFSKETVAAITAGIHRHGQAIADAYGGAFALQLREGMALINEKTAVEHVLRAGGRLLGKASTIVLDTPSLAGEDFGWYLDQKPGALVFIGSGSQEEGSVHSIHHPRFNVDEKVLVHGAKLHVELVKEANLADSEGRNASRLL